MKLKINFTVLFFSVYIFIYSQENKGFNDIQIEYDATYNNDITVVKKGFLIPYVKESKSNYYEYNKNKKIESTTKSEGEKTTTFLFIGDFEFVERNFVNFKTKQLLSIEKRDFDRKVYQIGESLTKLKWNLQHKDTLKVGGYMCNKATLNFRGRDYIAWYSKEIPLPYGPWKLNGLPGLIFKVYDETLRYDWTIKKIGKKTIDEDFFNKEKPNESLTLKEFIGSKNNLYEEKLDQLKKNTTTRQKRGVQVTFESGKNIGRNQELIFEWEEESKEN
jgi:GLPGLI family protein